MALKLGDRVLETTDQGFLCHQDDWDEKIACAMAEADGVTLTEAHWEIILFMRQYYKDYKHLPNARMFVRAIRNALGEEKGNSRYLQRLFPDGPLKYACKFGGLPKPPTCL